MISVAISIIIGTYCIRREHIHYRIIKDRIKEYEKNNK